MSDSVNTVIIIGRLGQDPEIISFLNGTFITKLSVATSKHWNDKNTGEKNKKPSGTVLLHATLLQKLLFKISKKAT